MNSNGFEQWGGYMEAKITKLEEQFSAASNPYKKSNLFSGISIYVNGLTNPSADELKRMMMVYGGTFHHYERSHTTYIIASNLPDVKVRNMNTSKIISPQWVVDCIKETRLLDHTRYLLYTNQKVTQPGLFFKKHKMLEHEGEVSLKDNCNDTQKEESLIKTDATNVIESDNTNCKDLARTAVDPRFLTEFYNNSRLHHIATLGTGFKKYVSDLREQHGTKGFPARATLKDRLSVRSSVSNNKPSATWIMHIDMDCFFVSVGLRKHPELKDQPVAVTHSKGGTNATSVPVHPSADRKIEMELFAKRFEEHLHNNILSEKVRGGFEAKMSLSEIASCSYEARAKGIRNGMFVGQALNLCPELKTIPYDFEGYREVAYTLYDTIAQYTLDIEAVSCDEMFVDLTDILNEIHIEPMEFVLAVREEVRLKTGCPCSAGVGGNKLQARMATKRAKPDGQYQLFPEVAQKYMADIKIDELPGVGSSTAYTLEQNNLITCGDLQKISLLKLQMHVGKKFGETLYQFSRGIDNRSLLYGQIRKSVSAEVNYGIRFKEFSELETFLRQLCTEVHTRLSDIKRQTKCVTLKLMVRAKDAPIEASKFMGHGVCDHLTKSVTLSGYTCELEVITRTVLATMKAMTVPPNELRGIGIQLSKLNDPNEGKERKENVIMNLFNKVADKKKERATKSAEDSNGDVAIQIEEPNVLLNCNSTLNVKKPEKHIKNVGKRSRDKIGDNNTLDAKSKNEPNILNLFKKAATKQAVSLNNLKCNGNPLPKDIDPEVFAALPPDIRNEVLHAYKDPKQGSALVTAQPQNQGSAPTIMLPPSQSSNNVSTLNESDLQPSTSKAAAFRNQQKQLQKKMLNKQKSQVNLNNIELKTIPQNIEQEFLDALPPELRNEIKENFAQPTVKYEATSEVMLNQIDPEFLDALPPELRQEIEQNFGKSHGRTKSNQRLTCETDDSLKNIFMEPKCEYLLLDWLKSSNVPEVVDTHLVSKHAAAMVKADKIDRLYSALMFLCKLINQQKSNECNWHKAYGSIIQFVQKEMSTSYDGRKLFLGVKLKCDKCKWQ